MKAYKTLEDTPKEVHSFEELDLGEEYSYADYLTWKFKERVELIKGKIFKMSPAPGRLHQEISGNLQGKIWNYLEGKRCKIYAAPFDVRLPDTSTREEAIYNVVQPDLCVICDLSKLDDRGCVGAPELIVEILSPGSSQRDLKDKYALYESSGVLEYWIIHPVEGTLLIYTLTESGYQSSRLFTKGDVVSSKVLPGFSLDLTEVFESA
jgi:Uma2 family endonuclease